MTNDQSERILLLWDIDGTLMTQIDRSSLFARAISPWVDPEFLSSWKPTSKGLPDISILAQGLRASGLNENSVQLLLPLACHQLGLCQQDEIASIAEDSPLLPGAEDALSTTEHGKVPIIHSLATGNTFLRAVTKLRAHNLMHHFQFFLGCYGDEDEDRAEMVRKGLLRLKESERFGAALFSSVWIIGDSIHDMSAASKNAISSIGVLTSGETKQSLLDNGASSVVESLSDIFSAIEFS